MPKQSRLKAEQAVSQIYSENPNRLQGHWGRSENEEL